MEYVGKMFQLQLVLMIYLLVGILARKKKLLRAKMYRNLSTWC